jgi:adenine-specific DNA-methyltransferase
MEVAESAWIQVTGRCDTRLSASDSALWTERFRQEQHPRCVPIYIQEKIHPQALVELLRDTAKAGEKEPELSLFDDFHSVTDFEKKVDISPPRSALVEPDDPGRLAARHDLARREGGAERKGPDDLLRPRLKRALRAEIDEGTWSTFYRTRSRPFAAPEQGRIAVKVINHYGDEVLKVFDV